MDIATIIREPAFGSAVLIWFMLAIGAGMIASEKKRQFWLWFLLGILLGPFALLWSLLASRIIPDEDARECPHCGGRIHKSAHKCGHCGRSVTAEKPDAAAKIGREAAGALFIFRRAMKGSRGGKPRSASRDATPTSGESSSVTSDAEDAPRPR